ncbi:MAPEG family protein [Sphingopyxis sp. JAI128]|uniref:MAPEG family protein n=1 Tax=Sphingopyxis sp. JAI128 TaxID=2723066 RepID=UPI00160F7DB8|nr:MAPEG family protein [Sphingopyxis sp. JAI128]MBB6425124.1 putative MAPEG superfamily protein [Sphingopyxis sp. JAI128]
MSESLLAPGAVLALWTILMLGWLAITRFSAMSKAGIDIKVAPPGGRGADLESVLPPPTNWKSHNYTHLCEQPTIFYAVILFLHLSGGNTDVTRGLAWAYVVLRIVHSLWQSTVNRVSVRFLIFSLATFCLFALSILAVIATLG